MVKFELENMTTGWCKRDSGVKHGCSLSPILFNINVRELGNDISNCAPGVKYVVGGKDGVMVCKNQTGFLYADDMCLMAIIEEDIRVIMEQVE